jgi:ketosteroid isomerase-like protein
MSEREASRPVNLPGAGTSADPDRTLTAPNFDENSIHAARAAVPLARTPARPRATRSWSLPLVALAVLAGVIGGGIGIFAINLYQKRAATQATQTTQTTPATRADARGAGATANVPQANGVSPANSAAATSAPAAPISTGGVTAAKEDQAAPGQGGARAAGGDGARELRAALGEWIDATNARDINRQMNFYDARLDAFYLARDASREAVRDEKARVFARASTVEVRADEPQIDLGADGQTATMRFRKQFNIEGGGDDRRGAVVQELRWRRTPAGWKITSERDLRVVN